MTNWLKIAAVASLILCSSVSAYPQPACEGVTLGIEAFKQAKYEKAARYWENALEQGCEKPTVHLYLATAYSQQFIPGAEAADNNRMAEQAIEHYQHVLDSDAAQGARFDSAQGIGYLYLNMKKFDDAKKYYTIASGLNHRDPESHYSVGVVDWTISYQARMERRAILGVTLDAGLDAQDGEQKKACDELRNANSAIIEEGIENLKKAIELRPDYDDAMAYMNLMYREMADLDCDDLAARAQDLATADHWVDEALRVKKLKAGKSKAIPAPTEPNPQ
jgi:tetratricopeptide (TPR) repeat protein